jgi:hypothetical protein
MLTACGAREDPGSGSSTHFLRACGSQGECGRGLSCLCGVCTVTCEETSQCADRRGDATCVSVEAISGECSTSAAFVCLAAESQLGPSGETGSEIVNPEPLSSPPVEVAPLQLTKCANPSQPWSQCPAEICFADETRFGVAADNVNEGLRCTGASDADAGPSCNADGQTILSFANEILILILSFDATIALEYSPETFTQGFQYLTVQVLPTNSAGAPVMISALNEPIPAGDPRIIELVYSGGRLQGRVHLGDVHTAKLAVETESNECVDEPVPEGQCMCDYALEDMPIMFDFDLPVEGAPQP